MKKSLLIPIVTGVLLMVAVTVVVLILTGREQQDVSAPPFEIYDWEPTFGAGRNTEDFTLYDATFDPETFKIEPVPALQDNKREDFMMGVDASMIKKVLDKGGIYYNEDGVEQDIFQILASQGVNYMRVRVWNDPFSPIGIKGAGDMDIQTAFWIAQRARAVNMRIILNLHYSDEWADPEKQTKPYAWEILTFEELVEAVETFTYEAMMYFKNRGVTPQMIQIGNEINNGLLWPDGRLLWNDPTSYDRVADLLKAGIQGAKEADQHVKTIIHLADGGRFELFDTFFSEMRDRNVHYDIIGASYYSFYHGPLADLQDNLNRVAEKFNKPVFVAETSYAFTRRNHAHASHIFGDNQEANGGYLATIQGQASSVRDVIEVVANVPNNRGLGIVYWEPAWLPVQGAGWAEVGTNATWSNQAFFTFSGRALPSLAVFNAVRASEPVEVRIVGLRSNTIDVNLNIASPVTGESRMPSEVIALTDVDAYRYIPVVWDDTEKDIAETTVGEHTVTGTVTYGSHVWAVTATVRSVENFVMNAGFEEGKTGANDEPVKLPWVMESTISEDVGKVQTNKDFRTGQNNFNYYHTAAFDFNLYQDIELENGTYELSVYVMGETNTRITELKLFAEQFGGERLEQTMNVSGWSAGYRKFTITDIVVTNGRIRIGVYGLFSASTWGHLDDFELIRID
ncbi:MAG: hypothetical protein EA374_03375 [Acholeplasmatales bacterium]|nr:MAG: hypothetical protein EA374_03375 [Acholeplasmatales bacterium]